MKLIQEDEDWFKFDVFPNFDRLIVNVLFSNMEGDIDIELYDQFYTYITGSYSIEDGEFLDYIVSPGSYHLRIYGPNWRQPYELLWDAINSSIVYDDNYEPNNSDTEADLNADLSFNKRDWLSEINGLGIQSNSDYFKIDVDTTYRRLFVEVIFCNSFGNIDVDIYNSSLNWITGSYSFNHNEFINFELPSSGIYFIKIWGDNTGIEYDLWWDDLRTDTRDDDSYEENDDPLSAYDISSHQYQDLWRINGTAIQRDNDWYKIFITSGFEHLFVFVTYDYQEGPIGIEIYDGDLSKVTENFTNEDNELINYDLPSNGTYYIRIHGYHSGNIYSLRWETWEPHIEDMIPGYDVVIILGAIFGVAALLTLKWKRSKKHL
ncbi:MAG: hypothetical protein CEE43_04090 [Promethearchaeota archaeon Loki_b32]|nr:MAG: hypothetical protein CEE43_04090 [Candidatus Lokiarchaeota archaeon Loki_b32]